MATLIFLLIIVIYIAQALFLSNFNNLVYGKKTALGWLPIANVYLLGKLLFNKKVGWALVGGILLNSTVTININGVETVYRLLPKDLSSIFSLVYSFVIFALFIYAIVKYSNLKATNK